MTRIRRTDTPGSWHHVMNRGIARRPLHENDVDIRTFLARIAECVRRGWIEVHAFTVLTNHFHLLVRSPSGRLSVAMQYAQNDYSRWFNRVRGRDGPLYRGRFHSKRVTTLAYRRHLVRYIDFNAVGAGLVSTPALYPFGSARAYAARKGPPWLCREWIESEVTSRARAIAYAPREYPACFGEPVSPGLADAIERRILGRGGAVEPLDRLLLAAGPRVIEQMQARATLADGGIVGLPVCDPDEVLDLVRRVTGVGRGWAAPVGAGTRSRRELLAIAALRAACGLSWTEIADRMEMSPAACWRALQKHQELVDDGGAYADGVERVLAEALAGARGVPQGGGAKGKPLAPEGVGR